MTNQSAAIAAAPSSAGRFIAITAAAAVTASVAAFAATVLAVPVWAMFIGWVAYYTRGHSARDGLVNFVCLALGLGLGMVAASLVGSLAPTLSALALPLVVLIVAAVVVSLRAVPTFNNIPSYFLGLISVFAAHVQPSLEAMAELGVAGAIGSFAGWLAGALQLRVSRAE